MQILAVAPSMSSIVDPNGYAGDVNTYLATWKQRAVRGPDDCMIGTVTRAIATESGEIHLECTIDDPVVETQIREQKYISLQTVHHGVSDGHQWSTLTGLFAVVSNSPKGWKICVQE